MKFKSVIIAIYAFLVLVGGIIGYSIHGSIASLTMGSISSILLALAAWGMWQERLIAKASALMITGCLCLFFLYRFFMTLKLMPAGLMTVISLLILFIIFRSPKRKKSYN